MRTGWYRDWKSVAAAVCVAAGSAVALAASPSPARATPPSGSARDHSHAYLGIEFHDTSDEAITTLHLQPGSHGVEVAMVDHDGPAGKAGLQPHDVIVQLDGKSIAGQDDLRQRLRGFAPGRVVRFAVMRMGQMLNVSVKLADRDAVERDAWQQHVAEPPPDANGPPDGVVIESYTTDAVPAPRAPVHGQSFVSSVLRMGPYTGMEVESMEPQLAQFFGAPVNSGVLVHSVDTNSPAASAGLRAGDVVERVDGLAVATPSEFSRRVRSAGGRAVTLAILRDRHEQYITMTPDYKRHSLLEWPKIF